MSMTLHEFADKINDIVPIMIKEFSRRHVSELYRGKITLPQFLILDFLYRNEDSKMSGLAHFMSVSTAAMTGMVERIVKYGYAIRESEPHDRRVIKIGLTLKGRELVKKINQSRRQMIIDVFGRVSEKDRSDYLRVLAKIEEILQRQAL
jgi:MarR family transcriptional regulator, organic hydroperoxide resistance regulator